ncbi:MAG: metallopeptidase family protein [Candidatus Saccharibacteria bacterium]
MYLTDINFGLLVSEAIDSLPSQYIDNLDNVAVVIENEPTEEQRQKLHLVGGLTLYGLYEGIPRTKRSGNYSLVLPDKITIFKNPILNNCSDIKQLKHQIAETVWHEIAHHYGLDHKRINELKNKNSN